MTTIDKIDMIRPVVKGAYDIQMLRMQMGLRLVANFGARLREHREAKTEAEIDKAARKVLDGLRESYKKLTSGVARRRTMPEREGFVGDPLISTFSELAIVNQFIELEKSEAKNFNLLGELLEELPIYTEYLKHQRGIGPAMAGVLVTFFDPYKARHSSSFHKYCGLDVADDGKGRSRREEHMVMREYKDRKGKMKERMSLTYNPWLKSKMFVLASSFMRLDSPWVQCYRNYKHRLESDPSRTKIAVNDWKKINDAGDPVDHLWPPGRIDNAAKRYMVKQFLIDFWMKWREMEGLPVTKPYHEAILGHRHGAGAYERTDHFALGTHDPGVAKRRQKPGLSKRTRTMKQTSLSE